ncbi:recombination U family protein [Bacillus clarus]|uniref:Holliday junction resolvase RecU n=1 Tax=Bacillus clarus TaxID=2338372 RepID=A0A090Y9U8_9BACI|nr:recombination U family protein [Bacillus clarus]
MSKHTIFFLIWFPLLRYPYEDKSTEDYDGVYKVKAIAFEAKSTESTTQFDLKNIAQHQLGLPEEDGSCVFLPYRVIL